METHEESGEKRQQKNILELYAKTGELALKQEIVLRYTGLIKSIALQMRNIYMRFFSSR